MKPLLILALACMAGCSAPTTYNESNIPTSVLGCDVVSLDSVVVVQDSLRTTYPFPCQTFPALHTRSDAAPGMWHLEAWAEGLRLMQGELQTRPDGSLFWSHYERSAVLDSFWQQRKRDQDFTAYLLGMQQWPDTGWNWLPFPLDSAQAQETFLRQFLSRSPENPLELPMGFPWSPERIDSLLSQAVAAGILSRKAYLAQASRILPQRYTDSLTYSLAPRDSAAWIPLPPCPGVSGVSMRRLPAHADACGFPANGAGLDHLQATQCAQALGGRIPTYAEWLCALQGPDSLPWPLPAPLPQGIAITGISGLLDDCATWLADSTGESSQRFLLIPARPEPRWSPDEPPLAAYAQAPLPQTCVRVVRSDNVLLEP